MSNNFAVNSSARTRSDTYTTTASGTTVNCVSRPLSNFGISVVGTGGTPTLWTIVLEGSLDGTNFSTILTHTQATGAGVVLWNTAPAAVLYFRSRCSVLTLGGATNAVATILGVP